jgi:hypothetical protein
MGEGSWHLLWHCPSDIWVLFGARGIVKENSSTLNGAKCVIWRQALAAKMTHIISCLWQPGILVLGRTVKLSCFTWKCVYFRNAELTLSYLQNSTCSRLNCSMLLPHSVYCSGSALILSFSLLYVYYNCFI